MDTSKLKSSGLVGDLVIDLEVHLDGIKEHEELCKTIDE
jgi:hypothetical protein